MLVAAAPSTVVTPKRVRTLLPISTSGASQTSLKSLVDQSGQTSRSIVEIAQHVDMTPLANAQWVTGGEDSGESDSDDNAGESKAQKQRQRTGERRLSQAADLDPSLLMSYLEVRSVSKPVLKLYQKLMLEFEAFMVTEKLSDVDASLDGNLCRFLNARFFQGHPPHVGEKILAAAMCLRPQCSRNGVVMLARSFRALKGWRKLVPARSRAPVAY